MHLLLLTVYVLPHRTASNVLTGLADLYMSRFFHQEWDLFAPEPPLESLKLMYQGFDENGTPLEIIYPAEEALNDHLNCRSATATKEVYLNRRYAQYLIDDLVELETSDPEPYSLLIARRYCSSHAQTFLKTATSMELIVSANEEAAYRSEKMLIISDDLQ